MNRGDTPDPTPSKSDTEATKVMKIAEEFPELTAAWDEILRLRTVVDQEHRLWADEQARKQTKELELAKALTDLDEARNDPSMKVRLVFEDWSNAAGGVTIYNTDLGMRLSSGQLHSGSTWEVELSGFSGQLAAEMRSAYAEHKACAVFRVVPVVDEVAPEAAEFGPAGLE